MIAKKEVKASCGGCVLKLSSMHQVTMHQTTAPSLSEESDTQKNPMEKYMLQSTGGSGSSTVNGSSLASHCSTGMRGKGATLPICCSGRCHACAVAGCSRDSERGHPTKAAIELCCLTVSSVVSHRAQQGLPVECQNTSDVSCLVPPDSWQAYVTTPGRHLCGPVPRHHGQWTDRHRTNVEEVATYVPDQNCSRVAILGDSLAEAWTGRLEGVWRRHLARVPEIVAAELAAAVKKSGGRACLSPRVMALGSAGDCTQHVLWRLQHGELGATMQSDPRLVSILTAGTNNLAASPAEPKASGFSDSSGSSVEEVAAGVLACARYLLNHTRGRVLISALLPRNDDYKGQPRVESASIAKVNDRLARDVQAIKETFAGGRVQFVDCSAHLIVREHPADPRWQYGQDHAMRPGLFVSDHLHLSEAGHAVWSRCLGVALASLGLG